MNSDRPYAPACDKNRDPIRRVLCQTFLRPGLVLEIGSGTGQHAVYFAEHLSHVAWQPTDLSSSLRGIRAWCEFKALSNVREPMELDVNREPWPVSRADYVFSANSTHIMSWESVKAFIAGAGCVLVADGLLCLYGPFNFGGDYSSASNARFDSWLKERDPLSGIRNFEDLDALAGETGMQPAGVYAMPANNCILTWKKGHL